MNATGPGFFPTPELPTRSTGQAHSGRAGPPPSKSPRSAASTAEEGTVAHGPTARLAGCGLAFTLNTSSYYGEIFRAGIESVVSGQREAARSTGLGPLQTMVYVILPQAIRNIAPDLISNTLEVVKVTSLASVVALPELLRLARVAQGLSYNPTPVVAAAVIYLLMLWPLVRLLSRLERRTLARH